MSENFREEKEKEVKLQKMFMLYLYFLINKKKRKINTSETEKKENKSQQKYFLIPPITDTFFNIEFNKYINLIDKDFCEKNDMSIEKYLKRRAYSSIPSKRMGFKMGKIISLYYRFVYIIFYVLKKKYNVKITDSFLYLVYLATNISPAMLVFAQLHSYKWFKYFGELEKKGFSFDEFFKENPKYQSMFVKIEEYLKREKYEKKSK